MSETAAVRVGGVIQRDNRKHVYYLFLQVEVEF